MKKTSEAEDQLRKTIDIYNSIMQGQAQDMKKSYENLQKEINNTQEIEAIASPEVRDLSRNRMMETREKYNAILMASNEAGGEVDTLFATLHDHVLFLGYDLNPSGVAALTEEATKLNEQADKLLASITEAVARVNEYIEATRAQ